MRVELARRLEKIPDDIVLHRAVSDPFYWIRQEIAGRWAAAPVLLDRLVAVEPTWSNYSLRARNLADRELWDAAIRDELEAARLTGERYWSAGTRLNGTGREPWQIAAHSVQAPGHPLEQYERAVRWVEARIRAQLDDYDDVEVSEYRPQKQVILGIGLFRLGKYADALARLQEQELPLIGKASALLISPWNCFRLMERSPYGNHILVPVRYKYDPVDLLVRAMCHHHLKHSQEAQACLKQARSELQSKDRLSGPTADQLQFLAEAESADRGKIASVAL